MKSISRSNNNKNETPNVELHFLFFHVFFSLSLSSASLPRYHFPHMYSSHPLFISLCVIQILFSSCSMHAHRLTTGNLDFENLSNSLYDEWNKCDRINAGSYGGSHDTQSTQKNRFELESIFVRVGLQAPIAAKVADEVYEKLGLRSNQSISFNEFLSLIQCDSDLGRQSLSAAPPLPSPSSITNTMSAPADDVYRCTSSSNIIIDDSMVNLSQIDLHAHSGLSFILFVYQLFVVLLLLY